MGFLRDKEIYGQCREKVKENERKTNSREKWAQRERERETDRQKKEIGRAGERKGEGKGGR